MSMTPDPFRKTGLGVVPSPSPFLTPRPDRRRPESRGSEWNFNRSDRDNNKEVNVQVLLRCRPLSDEEQRINVPNVIACNEHKREVSVSQSVANKQVDRVFTFDKVFGPKARQRSIYDQAIAPVVNEVLEGFNCTVFAYGQTGTGKTYTMEGGMRNKGGDLPAEAGVIPRAVRQIFDTLEAQNADYSMKVTFLELYNEEITDLLASEDNSRSMEDRQKKPISLMEDGRGCVVVRGLQEEAVYSANDIYTLLERGAVKRRTADTLLNKRSSRSHSVFSITVHLKEAAVGDEELIKCGKLYLVDLAGSENISRSGAREGRAREAGEINKSLLTLGRVINALAEHSTHIPYRDSKLTRLLRDSLGGKTKTCIIATISPSAHFLEETLSTLDYACRAKNIKNKPEANQKISKTVLLRDLYLEIERMKEDVRSARERNGIYVPHDRFVREEAEKKARIEKIEQLENNLKISEKEVDRLHDLYVIEQEQKLGVQSELKDCMMNLEKSNKELNDLQEEYRLAISTLKQKEYYISGLMCSENSLIERAKDLRADLESASEDMTSLCEKLDFKNEMEAENQTMVLKFGSYLDQSLQDLHNTILVSVCQQQKQMRCMEEHVQTFIDIKSDATNILESRIKKLTETYNSGAAYLRELANSLKTKASVDLGQMNVKFSSQVMSIEHSFGNMVLEAKEVIQDIQNSMNEQKELLSFSTQQQEEGLQRSLTSARVISQATLDFFSDLYHKASALASVLEESQIKKFHQLANFEKTFKEEAAREEKQALENIAAILAGLTSKKTAMVSEASHNIQDSIIQEKVRMQKEICNMQQVSSDANEELSKYTEKVESHFMEDTFLVAESKAIMENFLQECSRRVVDSTQQWDNAQSYIKNLKTSTVKEIESIVKEKIRENDVAHEKILSASYAMDSNFNAGIADIMTAVDESLTQDQETKKEMDSMNTLCVDRLNSMQENHGEGILKIRLKAEKCLTKDYLVDQQQHTGTTLKRRVIAAVPSLESIEEMRMSTNYKLKEEQNGSKWDSDGIKKNPQQLLLAASQNRAPFANVN